MYIERLGKVDEKNDEQNKKWEHQEIFGESQYNEREKLDN